MSTIEPVSFRPRTDEIEAICYVSTETGHAIVEWERRVASDSLPSLFSVSYGFLDYRPTPDGLSHIVAPQTWVVRDFMGFRIMTPSEFIDRFELVPSPRAD